MSTPVPPRGPTSLWPAAAVLITAVVMLTVFMVLNLATGTATPTTTTSPVVVGGVGIQNGALDGARLLAGCESSGEPPTDITNAFVLPRGTRPVTPAIIKNAGAGEYDCSRTFQSTITPAALLGFFKSQLTARGWSLFSTGASNGAPQMLFQRAGSDTFYWVVGVTVTNTTAHRVSWTYTVYQNSAAV